VLKLQKQLRPIFDLFKHFADFYLECATINWRYDVSNEETRKELYGIIIESIGRIQDLMFEELRKAGMDNYTISVFFRGAWGEVDEAKMLAKLTQQLEKMGLKKEGLDVIEKMPKPLRISHIVSTIQKVDGKFKLEKKKLHDDGRITPLH